MLFVVTCIDKSDGVELRLKTREQHLAYIRSGSTVKLGGPFLDEAGNMVGSFIIMEAEHLAAAEDWAAQDPYALAGLFSSCTVRIWKATYNPSNAAL